MFFQTPTTIIKGDDLFTSKVTKLELVVPLLAVTVKFNKPKLVNAHEPEYWSLSTLGDYTQVCYSCRDKRGD